MCVSLSTCICLHLRACVCAQKIKRLNASRHKRISASVKVVHNEYSTDFVCPNEASAIYVSECSYNGFPQENIIACTNNQCR